jgi:ribosome-binding ATPase
MGLNCGIVGLPNVGKSTLFNALTAANALAANYPFATKEPNVGMITVPDARLVKLTELIKPKSVVPTSMEIVDIAGLIKGASKGEGLGNQFLANIREVNAIIHVIRCFEDENVVHVDGSINPVRDKEIVDMELMLKDLETAVKYVEKFEKAAKSAKKEDLHRLELAKKLKSHLEEGKPVRQFIVSNEQDEETLKSMYLLTTKPVLYVLNVDEKSVINGNKHTQNFIQTIHEEDSEVILICAGIEADLMDFEDPVERQLFLEEMGLKEPGVNRVIKASYTLLKLITFFTAGEKEVRAWTVREGAKAPQAAGAIHSDFERGFIRAEVIKYEDYVHYGSEHAIKEAGKMHVEGKEYVIKDGDVVFFRFNV